MTLHSVFNNPDSNPQDPIGFPQFISCNYDTQFYVLYQWIDYQLIESAVQYRRRTSFASKTTLTICLVCAQKSCGHTVFAKIQRQNPSGWTLLSGTFHQGHTPGALQEIAKLRLSRYTRKEIAGLIAQGMTNADIVLHFDYRYCAHLSGEKWQYMHAHGGIHVSMKDVWYMRKRLKGKYALCEAPV